MIILPKQEDGLMLEPPPEEKGLSAAAIVVIAAVGIAGAGAAVCFFCFRKPL